MPAGSNCLGSNSDLDRDTTLHAVVPLSGSSLRHILLEKGDIREKFLMCACVCECLFLCVCVCLLACSFLVSLCFFHFLFL